MQAGRTSLNLYCSRSQLSVFWKKSSPFSAILTIFFQVSHISQFLKKSIFVTTSFITKKFAFDILNVEPGKPNEMDELKPTGENPGLSFQLQKGLRACNTFFDCESKS